ncbi:hypothetical protein OS175_06055 [Marinicella sp. S1101]|uniref:hypothetical protein n=1 Tax=Marinicella marina TaxID=2996016 RepID=UPI002260C7CD|nr:hypothetical protein [Marinicella marina]MCX7553435.1 hypothetical protein [Marinicella marina]MDJ1140059.1 hypothetical protein [Marinicella marina]
MIDFKFGQVMSTLWKTKEFVLFRFLIYMGITLAYIIGTGTGGGLGYMIGSVGEGKETGLFYGMVGGFTLVSGVLYYVREYLLYLVKAGHIAVIVKHLDGEPMPDGKGQIKYAQEVVKDRFKESSVLFGVDQLIKGVLKTFNRIFAGIMSFLPIIPQPLVKFINGVVNMSLTYVDEVILAYYIRNNSENPWEDSRKALVLYAQNYKTFLKNAVFLTIITWILSLLVLVIVFGPLAALFSLVGYTGNVWIIILAVVTAWGIKSALIDPIAMTALMQVFFKVTEGQEPNPEWEAKLERGSKKFVALKDKAMNWAGNKFGGKSHDDKDQLEQK